MFCKEHHGQNINPARLEHYNTYKKNIMCWRDQMNDYVHSLHQPGGPPAGGLGGPGGPSSPQQSPQQHSQHSKQQRPAQLNKTTQTESTTMLAFAGHTNSQGRYLHSTADTFTSASTTHEHPSIESLPIDMISYSDLHCQKRNRFLRDSFVHLGAAGLLGCCIVTVLASHLFSATGS